MLDFLDFIAANGETMTTTAQHVAAVFSKRHDHVLRDIRSLIEQLPDDFNGPNFEAVTYLDAKGESRASYRITRDGFMLLAMGFTCKKTLAFRVAYIKAFNAMDAYIRNQREGLQYRVSDTPDTSEKSAGYQPEPSIHAGCTPDTSDTSLFDDTEANNDSAPGPDRWCWPHSEAMNTAEIETFTVRLLDFTARGITHPEKQADRLVLRDREADGRRMCAECEHLAGAAGRWGCRNGRQAGMTLRSGTTEQPDELLTRLQSCDGFEFKEE